MKPNVIRVNDSWVAITDQGVFRRPTWGQAFDAAVRVSPSYGLGGGQAMDSFRNAAARMGAGTNSLPEATEYPLTRLSNNYILMLSLFRNHWLSRRIVETPAQDMVRAWPKLSSELKPEDIKRFERAVNRTHTQKQILSALKWGRLYGGAGALIVIDGHEDILDEPLDLKDINPGAYRGLIPFDRWSGIYPEGSICTDIRRPQLFGLPEQYRVNVQGGDSFKVHGSRILRFIGLDVPTPEYQAQNYWGISVLEPAFEEIRKRDNLSWSILNLTFRAQILAQTNPDLAQMLSGLNASTKALEMYYGRMEAQNELLSNQGMLILPKDGKMESFQYSFAGLADVYQQFQLDIAGAAQMPVVRLFGRTITGLGQSNDADERMYEERIAGAQHQELKPQLETLFQVVCMSALGEVPDDLDFNFPSVRVLTEEEKATLAKDSSAAIIEVFNTGKIPDRTFLRELQQISKTTEIFSNITDEDIEAASDKPDSSAFGELPPLDPSKPEDPGKVLKGANDSAITLTEIEFAGLPVTIEHPRYSWRVLRNAAGTVVYRSFLKNDYGFIRETIGRDGDEVDVIVGNDPKVSSVFIVDMIDLGPDAEQRQDEDKVMLGFPNAAAAKQAFLEMYPATFFGGMESVPMKQFVASFAGQWDRLAA